MILYNKNNEELSKSIDEILDNVLKDEYFPETDSYLMKSGGYVLYCNSQIYNQIMREVVSGLNNKTF